MAKTDVGYVKREVANEIDWSSIGSGIVTCFLMKEKQEKIRKKK